MRSNLTIKCLRKDGTFTIYPALCVTFYPPSEDASARAEFEMPDGVQGSLERGIVYVMNASGTTVQIIYLPESFIPGEIGCASPA